MVDDLGEEMDAEEAGKTAVDGDDEVCLGSLLSSPSCTQIPAVPAERVLKGTAKINPSS